MLGQAWFIVVAIAPVAAVIGADWSWDGFQASASYYHSCGLQSRSRPQSQSDQSSRHAAKDIIAQNNSSDRAGLCTLARTHTRTCFKLVLTGSLIPNQPAPLW